MNNEEQKFGGASLIIPKARRSIHSHNHCPFSNIEVMGRYGLDKKNNAPSTSTSTGNVEGVDEVDNVMSKFANPSSPILMKRKTGVRRNSPEDKQETDDESDASEFEYWSINNSDHQNRTHESVHTPQITRSRRNTPVQLPARNTGIVKSQKKSSKCSLILVPIIGILGVIIAFYSDLLNVTKRSNSILYDELEFSNDLSSLGRKYKITDDSLLQVQTGIATIYKRQDTGSFVFTYNSRMENFNQIKFNRFMDDIARTAARYLRNDSDTVQHIVVDGANLDMQSHGELIKRYKDDVDKSGVMLVRELDGIPSDLAMAFHYYCDEYNPLVRKSAIFFTLNLDKCTDVPVSKSILAHIEKCLKKKWDGSVPDDNIGPLLTRVVASVIDVTSV